MTSRWKVVRSLQLGPYVVRLYRDTVEEKVWREVVCTECRDVLACNRVARSQARKPIGIVSAMNHGCLTNHEELSVSNR